MEMRWQLQLAQLAQPVMSKEGVRDYQRIVSELWRATEGPEQVETSSEQSKDEFERVMGFSFVRTGKE